MTPSLDKFVDDSNIFPDVDISDVVEDFEPVKNLAKRFAVANLPLLIKDITQHDIGIPTFIASSIEWITSDYGYFVYGMGTHPDARIALMRAVTEVSQNRAGNVQGARDDLKKIRFEENDEIYKRRWEFMSARVSAEQSSTLQSSSIDSNKNGVVKFSEIKTYPNNDIIDDIKLVLNGLKKAGLRRAVLVDLTNPEIEIPVVRAIVPGLETFMITESIMGRWAKESFHRLHPKNCRFSRSGSM